MDLNDRFRSEAVIRVRPRLRLCGHKGPAANMADIDRPIPVTIAQCWPRGYVSGQSDVTP